MSVLRSVFDGSARILRVPTGPQEDVGSRTVRQIRADAGCLFDDECELTDSEDHRSDLRMAIMSRDMESSVAQAVKVTNRLRLR